MDLGARFLEGDVARDTPTADPPLAGRQRAPEPSAGSPLTVRTYRLPPVCTTQIVTKGRRLPSGRRDATASSSALPIDESSSFVHKVIDGSPVLVTSVP
jgi:hypothetical protein